MAIVLPQDEQTIRQWAAGQSAPVTFHVARDENPVGERLARFCDEFKALAPQVQILKAPDEPFRTPAMILGRHGNIAYQALPLGMELAPFLEALRRMAQTAGRSNKQDMPAVQIELPADLSLFITPHCPHCPHAVSRLLTLADENPAIRVTIVDGTLFEEPAKTHDIRSVPTLILDQQLRWSGQIDMAEVIRQCARRDPAQLSAASLRQIIETGEAARVAAMMSQSNRIFPAFIDLLAHQRWSVRLGAMVAVEYLADQSPELAAQLIAPLWQRFDTLEEPIQGDVVQVLGQINDSSAKQCLEKIASGPHAESVKEAAVEELDGWAF